MATKYEELDKIVVEKENMIRGTENTEKLEHNNVPYDEWNGQYANRRFET